MKNITGSCLCKKITFELEDDFKTFHWCHCRECQKVSGSAHASNLFTKTSNIKWLTGESNIKRYDIEDQVFSNAFCNHCGSTVPYISKSGKALIVPAGCLDQAPSLKPQDNIFWNERAQWYDAGLSAAHFDGFPE